jgi:membrane-associated phospholipid phosphatase
MTLPVLSVLLAQAGSVYDVDPVVFGAGAAASLAVGVLIDREKSAWDGTPACATRHSGGVCDRGSVFDAERFVTENRSRGARLASDVVLAIVSLAPYAVDGADVAVTDVDRPGLRFGEDALVALEVQSVTLLVSNALKLMVRRPRPLTYDPLASAEERFDGDARLSFPSGHASMAFASASVLTMTAARRHGSSALPWIAGGASYLTAAVVAYLRVAGGKHFVTDVLAGAVLGTAIGLLLPLASARDSGEGRDRVASVNGGRADAALSFAGRW